MTDKSDKRLEELDLECGRGMDKENGDGPIMFCISPPPRKAAKRKTERSKLLYENTNTDISPNPDFQSRNRRKESRQDQMDERMNAVHNTGRQPMKADHTASTHIGLMDSQRYTDHSSSEPENEQHARSEADDTENEDIFTGNTMERKENQKESLLRMLKTYSENNRNIRKLRNEVTATKSNIWKCCEEEEQWICRSEIHKNRVNTSLEKIANLRMEKPHLFPKPGERNVTLDEVREDLIKCRTELIFNLSQIQDMMQVAINEKTMERRRLGANYPRCFLSDFQEDYLKYRKTHGFRRPSLSVTCPPSLSVARLTSLSVTGLYCPAIDFAVFEQNIYSKKQNCKILIDGRQFNYNNDIGITQVMRTVQEENCLHGEFQLLFPKKSLNKTENRLVFDDKPQATSVVDVKNVCSNVCSSSLMSPRDIHSLMVKKVSDENMVGKKTSIKYLPPPRYTLSPKDNQKTINECNIWQKQENVRPRFENNARTEPNDTPSSSGNSGQSESEESVVMLQRNKHFKQINTQVQCEIHNSERSNSLVNGDIENGKQGNASTAKANIFQIVQEHGQPIAKKDHILKGEVWQSKYQILPEIRKSNEKPLTTEGNIKRQLNMSAKVGSYSILCDPKMVPVKILHRDKRSNMVTYLTTLVHEKMILPFSVTRQGSSIPVRMTYLKELFNRESSIPRFEYKQSTMSITRMPSRNYLYAPKEASNKSDEMFFETDNEMKMISSSFNKNQLNRSGLARGFNQQVERNSHSEQHLSSLKNLHNRGKNVKALDKENHYLATTNTTRNQRSIFPTGTRYTVLCNDLLTPESIRTNSNKSVKNAALKPSHIPVLCRGTTTVTAVVNASQNLIGIPRGVTTAGKFSQKPSYIPVPCRGTKSVTAIGNASSKNPNGIPVLCQWIMTAEKLSQNPSRIPVLCQGVNTDRKSRNDGQKQSRIPVLCRVKNDTTKCSPTVEKEILYLSTTCKHEYIWASYNCDYKSVRSSEIPWDVSIPYGKQTFVPHPPT